MGPRSIDRGNLRWPMRHGRRFLASMGPRSIDRGNDSGDDGDDGIFKASMGPRSIDRGNAAVLRTIAGVIEELQWGRDQSIAEIHGGLVKVGRESWLQWGRDQSIAEMDSYRMSGYPVLLLQWGRDQSIAEMTAAPCGLLALDRFNGAAINRSRKLHLS